MFYIEYIESIFQLHTTLTHANIISGIYPLFYIVTIVSFNLAEYRVFKKTIKTTIFILIL